MKYSIKKPPKEPDGGRKAARLVNSIQKIAISGANSGAFTKNLDLDIVRV